MGCIYLLRAKTRRGGRVNNTGKYPYTYTYTYIYTHTHTHTHTYTYTYTYTHTYTHTHLLGRFVHASDVHRGSDNRHNRMTKRHESRSTLVVKHLRQQHVTPHKPHHNDARRAQQGGLWGAMYT
jgi:hypothetical protein